MIYMGNIPHHRFRYVNAWSPVHSTVWGGYGTFWNWSLPRGSVSPGGELWKFITLSHFLLSLSSSLLCVCRWRCDLSVSCSGCPLPCLPLFSPPHSPPPPPLLWTLPLELKAKIKPSFHKLLLVLYHSNRKGINSLSFCLPHGNFSWQLLNYDRWCLFCGCLSCLSKQF